MKETIYIEIPIEIEFTIDPGQKGRFSGPPENCQPEYPACVEDVEFNPNQVLKEVDSAIYGKDSTVEEQLMEAARQKKGADEEYQADIKYQEMKERYNESEY